MVMEFDRVVFRNSKVPLSPVGLIGCLSDINIKWFRDGVKTEKHINNSYLTCQTLPTKDGKS